MFDFFKNKEIELTDDDFQDYLIVLTKISQVLQKTSLIAQNDIVLTLISLVQQKDVKEFKKLINGLDMWGGSGSVWEVNIEDQSDSQKFEKNIIVLINLMESTKILGRGITPIRKLFQKNVNNIEN